MKFVFKHRDDMARWMEILIFVAGAVVGLFMNDAIILDFHLWHEP